MGDSVFDQGKLATVLILIVLIKPEKCYFFFYYFFSILYTQFVELSCHEQKQKKNWGYEKQMIFFFFSRNFLLNTIFRALQRHEKNASKATRWA